MNNEFKRKIRKLKEENRKLRKNKNKIDINQYTLGIDYIKESKEELIKNALKCLVKRHYGSIEHKYTMVMIDEREIEAMKPYRLSVEKNPYMRTLEIRVM